MEINTIPFHIRGVDMSFAKSVRVTGAKGFVFVSGVLGEEPGSGHIPSGMAEQTTLALLEVERRLEEQGSSLDKICHILWHVKGDPPDDPSVESQWRERNEAEQAFWAEHCPSFVIGKRPPASTLIPVRALGLPEALFEVTVTAAVG
jgi:enamine deaminase RidA (YjgF/YER057c/UK114 family)